MVLNPDECWGTGDPTLQNLTVGGAAQQTPPSDDELSGNVTQEFSEGDRSTVTRDIDTLRASG